jgi:single-stranded-DNA-specific exonuclease
MCPNPSVHIDPRVQPKVWIDPEPVPADIEPLHEHRLLHALLYRRGIRERAEAERFLDSDTLRALDPTRLPDFERAVERIAAAVRGGERIGIFGDYDVDGTTSVAILGLALRAAGAGDRTFLRLPTRSEGYGLNRDAIDEFVEAGVTLLIALDCGSSDHAHVAYARARGLDAVIVDHHQILEAVPEDAIVVSAYRPEGGVYRELSAAGLSWLLVDRLYYEGIEVGPDQAGPEIYLDLAALGLIGDVSAMIGASRAITRAGLEQLARAPRPGIAALAQASNVDLAHLNTSDISFRIAPRLNAAGRMGDPTLALDLLLAPNPVIAYELVMELEALNARRKTATDEITGEAERLIRLGDAWEQQPVIVVRSEGWQGGVLGIVAARLAETYDRPALVLVEENGLLRGSMRAPDGFDVAGALSTCSPLLRSHGGHRLAGGLSLDAANFGALVDQLGSIAADRAPAPSPTLRLDAVLQEKHLSLDVARVVRTLEPFGPGNDEPVFVMRGVRLQKYDTMGQGKQHLSLTIGNGRPLRAAFFNGAPRSRELVGARWVDLAFTLGERDWNGPKLDVIVKDFRPSVGNEESGVGS